MPNLNQKYTQCNFYVNDVVKIRTISTQTSEKRKNNSTQTVKARASKYDVYATLGPRLSDAIVQTEEIECIRLPALVKTQSIQTSNALVKTQSVQTSNVLAVKTKSVQTDPLVQTTANNVTQTDDVNELFELFPNELGQAISAVIKKFKSLFCVEKFSSDSQSYLEISRKGLFVGLYHSDSVKYVLTNSGVLKLCSIFKGIVKEQNIINANQFQVDLVTKLLKEFADENFVFCEGLGDGAKQILAELTHKPKQVVIHNYPVNHLVSSKCESFFNRPVNIAAEKGNICKHCQGLNRYLRVCQKRRMVAVSSPIRKRKSEPSSTVPTQFLSPYSVARKKRLVRFRYQNMKKKIGKLTETLESLKMNLNSSQHKEMKDVASIIQDKFPEDVDSVLNIPNSDQSSTLKEKRKQLHDVWEEDCATYLANESEDFTRDQANNTTGSRKNRWSVITYRIALAIACRSHAAYEALKSFKILQLPSWRTIQRKTQKNLDEPGVEHEKIREQKRRYDLFVEEQVKRGYVKPNSDGILVFDEVKVAAKVAWNSKNHKLAGLAMPIHEYFYLEDLYDAIDCEKDIPKANYMLQFLWRDLSSNYDIIGPYFSVSATADSYVTFNCLFQVLKAFQLAGFNISAIVCDGASANLAVIKQAVELNGTFTFEKKEDEIDVEINPSFPNPYRNDRNIYFIICPSHQLKNMINALWSSHDERPKTFTLKGVEFGWKQIVDLKKRKDELRKQRIPRLVPKLLQSYIVRDQWTKLNVKPARIMQQYDVLSAIYEYAHPKDGTKPDDYDCTIATYNYLKACHLLFEEGTLCKTPVKSPSDVTIQNLVEGLNFFSDWLKDILSNEPEFNLSNPRQKFFISWQTWGLLRIMVYGMKGLAEEYLNVHGQDYYLCPLRINGSSVETLFSQMKYNAGGKVTSLNFCTARKNILTRIDTKGHQSGKGYRDTMLYVRDSFAEKFGK